MVTRAENNPQNPSGDETPDEGDQVATTGDRAGTTDTAGVARGPKENRRRIQSAKDADRQKQFTPQQLEDLDNQEVVKLTSPTGAKVETSGKDAVQKLKALGFKGR